jgi:hypothetical protein
MRTRPPLPYPARRVHHDYDPVVLKTKVVLGTKVDAVVSGPRTPLLDASKASKAPSDPSDGCTSLSFAVEPLICDCEKDEEGMPALEDDEEGMPALLDGASDGKGLVTVLTANLR